MPNSKTDINNRGGISTDMIGYELGYPEADYDRRARYGKRMRTIRKGFSISWGMMNGCLNL